MQKKFVIYSPRQAGGGAIVLHSLCKILSDLGYDARIFYMSEYPYRNGTIQKAKYYVKLISFDICDLLMLIKSKMDYRNLAKYRGYKNISIKGCRRKLLPVVDKNTIVIYPEKIYGNPLHAKNVIRWFLFYYEFADDIHAYGEQDLFVTYRDEFNNSTLNPKNIKLHTPFFNLNLYKRTNYGERKGKCYILHKGRKRDDIPSKLDGPVIDNLCEEDKVKILNQSEYCISYDTQTAYSQIAALCGCKSIIIPEPGKGVSDYRRGEDTRHGVAIGFTEPQLEYAMNTVQCLLEEYQEMNRASVDSVKEFVKYCNIIF